MNLLTLDRDRVVTRRAGADGKAHGGVLMLIREDLNFKEERNGVVRKDDQTTEFVAAFVQVPGRRPMRFINFYIPPINERDANDDRVDNFDPSAIRTTRNTFAGGDINAHSAGWDVNQPQDARALRSRNGCLIEISSQPAKENRHTSTRRQVVNQRPTSPSTMDRGQA